MKDGSDRNLLNRIRAFFRIRPNLSDGADLTEEIQDLMDEGQAKGLISGEESEMVHGVLDLKETKAQSIMIPRTGVRWATIHSTLGEIVQLVTGCGHTRIPICKGSMDEVVGILHAKDLLRLWGQDLKSRIPPEVLRKAHFVPLNQKVSEILKELRAKKSHLAIVTDEYGGTAGIITIEDILEEIVGEILDEHDNEGPLLTPLDDDSVLVNARLEIEKLEHHLGVKLPEGPFESVGGFVIHLLGKVPKTGEKILFRDLEMTIKSSDMRKIQEILVKRQPSLPPADSE